MPEKVLPGPWLTSSDQHDYRKNTFRLRQNSKLILSILLSVTLVAGVGSSTIFVPKLYGQNPPSSLSEENVCTAEEQAENVCTSESPSFDEGNVCTAEDHAAKICTPQESDLSCEGNLREEYASANDIWDAAFNVSKQFAGKRPINGIWKTAPFNNLYWFPKLYEYTTMGEIESIQKREHKHPAMVAHFIPIFFGLYKQAIDNYQKGDYSKVSPYWMNHFKTADNRKITLWNTKSSLETAVTAHIVADMPKAIVLAYESFTNKYCPASPPPLDYFRSDFFSPNALKIFPKSQADIFTEISRVMHSNAPFTPSIEKGQLILGIGSEYVGIKMKDVIQWREDAWEQAKKELGQ